MIGADDMGKAVAVTGSRPDLDQFRGDFYQCLTRRRDALFELADAVLCASGPVRSLVELSLDSVHQRGHGGMYDALAEGVVEVGRLRRSLAGLDLPRSSTGQLRVAVDVTAWPRPDAECSPLSGVPDNGDYSEQSVIPTWHWFALLWWATDSMYVGITELVR
jgi:hypothetical protein